MARAIVQVALDRRGSVPEDVVVNTWHFESDDSFDVALPGLLSRVETFYTAGNAWWGGTLAGPGRIRVYDYADAKPRVPVADEPITVSPGGGSYPNELCICLSMEAEQVSGGIKARRRGRVFLGPVTSGTQAALGSTDNDVQIAGGTRTTILDAAEAMADGTAGAFKLAVFSPRTKATGGTDDEAWNDVTRLWVDNRYDIQRRRGARPTVRDERLL